MHNILIFEKKMQKPLNNWKVAPYQWLAALAPRGPPSPIIF